MPITGSSPIIMKAADRALAAVESLEPGDQLAALGWATVAVLGALKDRFGTTPPERAAFDRLCSETQAWLRLEIEMLRFTKEH